MPVYTVELTYIQCVAIEAANEAEAVELVLNDEELPYPSFSEVTGVEVMGEDGTV